MAPHLSTCTSGHVQNVQEIVITVLYILRYFKHVTLGSFFASDSRKSSFDLNDIDECLVAWTWTSSKSYTFCKNQQQDLILCINHEKTRKISWILRQEVLSFPAYGWVLWQICLLLARHVPSKRTIFPLLYQNVMYIVTCQGGGVSNEPPDLWAATIN